MSDLSKTLTELITHIALCPHEYASAPEQADGMIESLSTILLHYATGRTFGECEREVHNTVRVSMENVYPTDQIGAPLLCDESYPAGVASFDAFRLHSKRFVELLEEKTGILREDHEDSTDQILKTLNIEILFTSDHPGMVASRPEQADGVIRAAGWIALHVSSGKKMESCISHVNQLVRRSTEDVCPLDQVGAPLLCDESYPAGIASFDAFRLHSKRFVKLLEEELASPWPTDQ